MKGTDDDVIGTIADSEISNQSVEEMPINHR